MNKKKILIIVIAIFCLFLIIGVVTILKVNSKSENIKLELNYKSLVGVTVDSDIILVINQKDIVSNIIYLNDTSVLDLANQKIEGKDISTAIELIVDKLKNQGEFDNGDILYLTKYDNVSFSKVMEEFNKEFVVYGISNKIIEKDGNLDTKLNQLDLETNDDVNKKLKILDEYSKKLLRK